MNTCPNVLPGAQCIDPECAYCRVAEAEEPRVVVTWNDLEPVKYQPPIDYVKLKEQ